MGLFLSRALFYLKGVWLIMIYTIKYPHSTAKVDTDRIARKFDQGGQVFVRFFADEDRLKLIEFLESEGFRCIESRLHSRRRTIESVFPLVIELDRKSISEMGSVTCAAAAAQAGVIMSDRDFYLLYSMRSLQK